MVRAIKNLLEHKEKIIKISSKINAPHTKHPFGSLEPRFLWWRQYWISNWKNKQLAMQITIQWTFPHCLVSDDQAVESKIKM